jgi:hypothetical protein
MGDDCGGLTVELLVVLAELDAIEEDARDDTSSPMISKRWRARERRAKRLTFM